MSMKNLTISPKKLYDCLSGETAILHPKDAAALLCTIYESAGQKPPEKYKREAQGNIDCDYDT